MPATQTMSAEEYLACEGLEGRVTSLVEGEVVVNEPTFQHQFVCDVVQDALRAWSATALGHGYAARPLDILLDERNVYAADVIWYAGGRVPGRRDPRPYPMPDLAVEVRSPSTWRYEIGAKKAGYERHGLAELWLVDLAAEVVLVFRRSSRDAARFDVALELDTSATLASPLLPGFELGVAALFAE